MRVEVCLGYILFSSATLDKKTHGPARLSETKAHLERAFQSMIPRQMPWNNRRGEALEMQSSPPSNCLCTSDQLWLGRVCLEDSVYQDWCEVIRHEERTGDMARPTASCSKKTICEAISVDVDGRQHTHCRPGRREDRPGRKHQDFEDTKRYMDSFSVDQNWDDNTQDAVRNWLFSSSSSWPKTD